jgi:hypothetical protein
VAVKGEGKTIQWIRDHINHQGDCCLIWPFFRNPNGYGQLGYLGKGHYAHRLMCEMAHGAPAMLEHEAAHSCGNGHMGCANPKHLSWKTPSGNRLDCRTHGTEARHFDGNRGRLTDEQVLQIRTLQGKKTQAEIAFIFGVSQPTIRDIFLGRSHTRPSKIRHYSAEEDAQIRAAVDRGCSFQEISEIIGRPVKGVSAYIYRSGLTLGRRTA